MGVVSAAIIGCGSSPEAEPQVPIVMTEPPPVESRATNAGAATSSDAQMGDAATEDGVASGKRSAEINSADADAAAMKEKQSQSATGDTAIAPKIPSGSATATAAAPVEGKLVSRVGSTIVIDLGRASSGAAPSAGQKGVLYRFFEQDIGPIHTTGWLGIADVTVKDVKGSKIRLDLVAEKSVIMLNGKKVNHFESGNQVKLEITQ